jgi:type IV secretory pathway VirB4 component
MQPNNQIPATNPGGAIQPVPAPAVNGQPAAKQQPHMQPGAKQATNLNSTQNSLEIAAIRDGIVIMKDGSFRSVVMAKSINFDLMSQAEQEAVEYAYQGFLNSLYFDIQVFIRSRKIDMGPYLEKLTKVRTDMDNMLLGMLMEDYVFFIEDLVQQTNIMSKEFYIVVPFFGQLDAGKALQSSKKLFSGIIGGEKKSIVTVDEASLEKAKSELTNRVQNVVNGLLQLGVQAIPLDTQELIELYYNAYNPDTATRQTLKNADQLTVPLVTKGDGHAPTPSLSGEI